MSRNIHHKLSFKASRRRVSRSPSTVNLSDDDGYSALEDISDSEDDDEDDVKAAEEENILTEDLSFTSIPRPSLGKDKFEHAEEEHDEDEDDVVNTCGGEDVDDRGAGWTGIAPENKMNQLFPGHIPIATCADVQSHVHFDISSSSSDSTVMEDDHDDLFPDIFVAQNLLDPTFRREIEHDADDSCGSSSYWDVHSLENQEQGLNREELVDQLLHGRMLATTPSIVATGIPTTTDHITPSLGEKLEPDGYETDDETTDKDVPEPPIRKNTRRPSNTMSEDFDFDEGFASQPQHGQPRVGRFKLDRSDKKPIGVLNPLTRTMMIFTPDCRRSLDLSLENFRIAWPWEEQHLPLSGHSANLMISAMVSDNRLADFINGSGLISGQPAGPTEAFFPFSHETNTTDDDSLDPSEDEEEMKLNVDDFISWHDDNDASSVDDDATSKWDPMSTPVRPATALSEFDLLSHLNPDIVGAFRRNQINQQLILSNQATQDSLTFSAPYNYTALKGLKSDRFDTAELPLTPIRRQKNQLGDTALSPLETMSAKRKVVGESGESHKRHRSIRDVDMLHV